jgi:ATP-dependent Clp protease ATP-binding subunit ClpB
MARQKVSDTFFTEFLNRVDDIIIFHNLTREDLKKIIDLQLADLRKRLAPQDLKIEVSDKAKDLLMEMGYDRVYGARPLKRVIQREIQNPLAKHVLAGDYPPGKTIHVDVAKGKFTFK